MNKEEALREVNRLCDSAGAFLSIQDGEFAAKEFAVSRGCSLRTASKILVAFEKDGKVSRRRASCPTGGTIVWRFVQETPPGGLQREPSRKIPVQYLTHSE